MTQEEQQELERRRALWCAALESGAYTQTRDYLRDDSGYCCLGVLQDLFMAEHPGVLVEKRGEDGHWAYWPAEDPFYELWETLHHCTLAWVGLTPRGENILAEANDSGKHFREIARMIRKQPDLFAKSA